MPPNTADKYYVESYPAVGTDSFSTMSDQSSWRGPLAKVIVAVVRIIYVFVNNLYSVPAYMLYLYVLRPLKKYDNTLYWTIEGVLFRWLTKMVSFWMWNAGYTVAEMGDDVSDITDDGAIVICNHQSTGDVPTLFYAFQHLRKVMDQTLWIMDVMFKYTNFGVISQFRGDFFIQQGKETRHLQGDLLRDHLLKYYWSRNRRWIVLFPEGGFLRKRRATSKEYGRKNGFPVLEHVTLPRVGAMQTVLQTLASNVRPHDQTNGTVLQDAVQKPLKWIIDITIGYPGGRPMNMQTVIAGQRPPEQTMVYYRKYLVSDVPTDTEGLTKWMYERFEEKEHLLEEFYATGCFPESPNYPNGTTSIKSKKKTTLEISTPEVLSIKAFYLLLSTPPLYFLYTLICGLLL